MVFTSLLKYVVNITNYERKRPTFNDMMNGLSLTLFYRKLTSEKTFTKIPK